MTCPDVESLFYNFLSPYIGSGASVLLFALTAAGIAIGVVSGFAAVAVYAERKVSAIIQCRLGPMEVGPEIDLKIGRFTILPKGWYGLGTLIGDGVKLMAKEDIIPRRADPILFRLAPYVVFGATMAAFSIIPAASFLAPSSIDGGILFLLAASSVGVFGIVMGGYASNNKWSLYGAMRSVAQVVSYEVPMGLALLSVVLTVGSLDMRDISNAQVGWFLNWHVFQNPFLLIAFVAYFIAGLAETNRAPFDIPEAESELVSGYHTEYSGMRFSMFFLAEYANMLLVSLVAAVFFLGGYNTGIAFLDSVTILGPIVIITKATALVLLMIWLRWTLPRYRVDQLMTLCWKGLLPVTVIAFLGAGIAVMQTGAGYRLFWRAAVLFAVGFFWWSANQGLAPMPRRAGEEGANS